MVFPRAEHTERKRGYLRLLDIQSAGKAASENKMACSVGIPASQAILLIDLPRKNRTWQTITRSLAGKKKSDAL